MALQNKVQSQLRRCTTLVNVVAERLALPHTARTTTAHRHRDRRLTRLFSGSHGKSSHGLIYAMLLEIECCVPASGIIMAWSASMCTCTVSKTGLQSFSPFAFCASQGKTSHPFCVTLSCPMNPKITRGVTCKMRPASDEVAGTQRASPRASVCRLPTLPSSVCKPFPTCTALLA